MSNYKRTSISKFDYFPIFIDYSFAESKPRGGSAFVDFFACGRLCALMDEVNSDGAKHADSNSSDITFVSKGDILPDKGFFLIDFAKAQQQPDMLVSAVQNMNLSHIYVEDSAQHSIRAIFDGVPELMVDYVAFRL